MLEAVKNFTNRTRAAGSLEHGSAGIASMVVPFGGDAAIVTIRGKGRRVSWLSRGPDLSDEVWIGCKLILKLSKVLIVEEVKGSYRVSIAFFTLDFK